MVLDSIKGTRAVFRGVHLFVFPFSPVISSGIAKEFLIHCLWVIGRIDCSKQMAAVILFIYCGAKTRLNRRIPPRLYGLLHLTTVSEYLCFEWSRVEWALDAEGREDHGRSLASGNPPSKSRSQRTSRELWEPQVGALEP